MPRAKEEAMSDSHRDDCGGARPRRAQGAEGLPGSPEFSSQDEPDGFADGAVYSVSAAGIESLWELARDAERLTIEERMSLTLVLSELEENRAAASDCRS
jgi:hypothetical protein